MGFFEDVYNIVRQIPIGKVATYGQIAALLGSPKSSRAVGYALHGNPYFGEVPCHRVVNRYGALSKAFVFGGINVQAEMLLQENVVCDADYIVDLTKYKWDA